MTIVDILIIWLCVDLLVAWAIARPCRDSDRSMVDRPLDLAVSDPKRETDHATIDRELSPHPDRSSTGHGPRR